jgi:hypothetical protein
MKTFPLMLIFLGAAVGCSRSPLGVDDAPSTPTGASDQPLLCQPGDSPVVLTRPGFHLTTSLAIGGASMSWWDPTNGILYSAPLTGGATTKLASGPDNPAFDARVLIDGQSVAWSGDATSYDWAGGDGGWIRTVTPGAAPAIVLQKLDSPVLLSAAGGALTWLTSTADGAGTTYSYGLGRRGPDGATKTLPVAGITGTMALSRSRTASSGASLVLATGDAIAVASATTGAATVLARTTNTWLVGADQANAYWLDILDVGQFRLFRAPLAGGSAPVPLAVDVTGAVLGVADGAVYFEVGLSIVRLSLADGTRRIVLDASSHDSSPHPGPMGGTASAYEGRATDIAVDASCAYVAYPGAIVRVPK